MTRDELISTALADQRGRIASAKALIDQIENHGTRFFEGRGSEPLRDFTDEYLAEQYARIRSAEAVIAFMERGGATQDS